MTLPFELQLAARNLTRHPWHTAAMVAGLAMAVLVMIYIGSTMASFYDDIIDRAVEQNSAHVTIWPLEKPAGQMERALRDGPAGHAVMQLTDRTSPRRRDLPGYHALSQQASQVNDLIALAPFVRGNATISRGRLNLAVAITGMEGVSYSRVVNIAKHFRSGVVPKLGPDDIALGFRLADKLAVEVGDHIHVATPQTSRLMRVRAIFRSGYYDKDLGEAFVALRTAQRMFAMGNEVSALAGRCGDLNEAGIVTASLAGILPCKIRNWMDDNASLLAEIATVSRVTLFINVLVAAVAAVGMANVFSMFVLNRRKELAILRAVGASRGGLRAILLAEAAFIWAVGTIIGAGLSLVVMAYEQSHPYTVSAETYGIGSYATQPKAAAFVSAIVLAAITMLVSAWWSSRKAVKMNPAAVIFGR